jgi:hypothetical protein
VGTNAVQRKGQGWTGWTGGLLLTRQNSMKWHGPATFGMNMDLLRIRRLGVRIPPSAPNPLVTAGFGFLGLASKARFAMENPCFW